MKTILKKCIDELTKPDPKLDYIRGMLEVLVEQEPEKPVVPPVVFNPPALPTINQNVNPHGLPSNDPGMDILSGKKIING